MTAPVRRSAMDSTVRYARTSDGVTIAYAELGDGPALVSMPSGLLSSIAAERQIPSVARGYRRLAQDVHVVAYDARGTGSSQRDVDDVSLEAMIRDLEAVVEHAGLERFALLGYYFTAAAAIAYAARNPERVTGLVIFGGALRGERTFSTPFSQALTTLIDQDWDAAIESAVHAWLGWSGTEEERLAVELYRESSTPAMARKLFAAAREMDVSEDAAKVTAPALVIYRHEERQLPLAVAEEVAAALPDATLLRLEGASGLLFLEDPDADVALLLDFLLGHRRGDGGVTRPVEPPSAAAASTPVGAPPSAAASPSAVPSAVEGSSGAAPLPPSGRPAAAVFISCSERQKQSLGQPFKALLAERGLRGFVVSDEPRPDGTWTPEEKVDAYLARSDAVVVFATGDLEAGEDRYTRPNIGDEIGRARAQPHLRNRVVVLKEHGVTLPSNINPAYESLDPADPRQAFERALAQLREWGFRIDPA